MRNLHTDIAKINKKFDREIAKIERARARDIAKAVMQTERAAFRLQNKAARMLEQAREASADPRIAEAIKEAHATREARARRAHEKLMAARAAKRAERAERAERAAKHTAANRAAAAADAKRAIKEMFGIDIE